MLASSGAGPPAAVLDFPSALRQGILGVVHLDMVVPLAPVQDRQTTPEDSVCVGSVAGVFSAVTEQLRSTLLSGVNKKKKNRATGFHL